MHKEPTSDAKDRAVRGAIVVGLIFTFGVIAWASVTFMKAEGIW